MPSTWQRNGGNLVSEQWRDIFGYVGYYQVSDRGRVRSLDRIVPHARYGTYKLKGKLLPQRPRNKYGHLIVGLYRDNVRQMTRVHQLVAVAFIGPCPPGQEVCHGSHGVSDNSLPNLSYGTHRNNMLEMRRDGTHCGRPVKRSDGVKFVSLRIAAEETGCWAQSIWKVCNGKQKTAGGYGWNYV